MAGRPGKTFSYKDDKDRRDRCRFRSATIRTCSSRRSGKLCALRGVSTAADPAAESTNRATAAQPGQHLEGHGLPEGVLGRIGVSVSGADSNRVYAMIEAKDGGLYRSDDAGETWRARQRTIIASASAPGISRTSSPIRKMPTRCMCSTPACIARPTVEIIRRSHRAAWRSPRSVDRSHERESHDQGDDGGATISTMAAKPGAPQTISPPRSSITSRRTIAVSVLLLWRAAGQHHGSHRQPQRLRRYRPARLVSTWRRRKRLTGSRFAQCRILFTQAPTTA